MSQGFEVCFTYEIEDDVEIPLRVFGRVTPWLPEIKPTLSDPGSPAEGRELEDLQVFSGARLAPEIESRLIADPRFLERVEASL